MSRVNGFRPELSMTQDLDSSPPKEVGARHEHRQLLFCDMLPASVIFRSTSSPARVRTAAERAWPGRRAVSEFEGEMATFRGICGGLPRYSNFFSNACASKHLAQTSVEFLPDFEVEFVLEITTLDRC